MTDLWPDSIETAKVKSPAALLREQASLLGRKTRNLVQAEVKGGGRQRDYFENVITESILKQAEFKGESPQRDYFHYSFQIVAPALDYYRYELFTITHDIQLYPLIICLEHDIYSEIERFSNFLVKTEENKFEIKSENEFLEILKAVFGSEKTRRVITALLSQLDFSWRPEDDDLSAPEANSDLKTGSENTPLAS